MQIFSQILHGKSLGFGQVDETAVDVELFVDFVDTSPPDCKKM